MQRRWTRPLIALTAISLLAAGCGDDDEKAEETPTEEESSEVEATQISVTGEDYRYVDAPEEIDGGLVEMTFENTGQVPHEAAFAEIGDSTVEQFITDFAPVIEEEGSPFPDYVTNVAVPGGEVAAGETITSTFLLPEGNYVMFCTFDGKAADESASTTAAEGSEGETGEIHFKLGMAQAVTVTGDNGGELPDADGTVTARDYEFDVDVSAGDSTMKFVNEGPNEVHHAVFFPFTKGTTEDAAAAALDAFLNSQGDGPPPPEFDFEGGEGLGDAGVYSTGLGEVIDQSFESGRTYAVVCFLSDRAGGPPHVIANDMKKIFTVE